MNLTLAHGLLSDALLSAHLRNLEALLEYLHEALEELDAHGERREEHIPAGAEVANGPAQEDQNQDPQEAPEQTGTAALAAAHFPNCGC